jgi:protein-S-isoprenylcysteine O-methyltransferase Ste14
MIALLKNYFSTILFILLLYLGYSNIPFYQELLLRELTIQTLDFKIQSISVFQTVIALYICLLPLFYIVHTEKSKALIILEYIWKKIRNLRYKLNQKEKLSILSWMVKSFWAPLMIFWLSEHISSMIGNSIMTYGSWNLWKINFLGFFDAYFFYFCFSCILFFDVLLFTLGYLIESPKLGNTIKSVESTWSGWVVTIICYPPLNSFVSGWWSVFWLFIIPGIGWYSQEFPKFDSQNLHIIMNSLILILMWLYASASVSLGFKASNLTNRGIVQKWLYKYIRHPAYICKNLAWWIWGLPFMMQAITTSDWRYLWFIVLWLSGWSFIYFLRAWTEERHLSLDPDYREYKKKVKYRFIPWLI